MGEQVPVDAVVVSRADWEASQSRLARLEAIVERMTDQSRPDAERAETVGGGPFLSDDGGPVTSRRRLIVGLASVAGAGALLAGGAEPAAAADGGPIVMGQNANVSNTSTGLVVSPTIGVHPIFGFGVTDNGFNGSVPGTPATLFTAKGTSFDSAIAAIGENAASAASFRSSNNAETVRIEGGGGTGSGLLIQDRDSGVQVAGASDVGVQVALGTSGTGIAIVGPPVFSGIAPAGPGISVSTVGPIGGPVANLDNAAASNVAKGVVVNSVHGNAVDATSASASGVYGKSTSGYGTAGRSEANYGVVGVAKTGMAGVYGQSEDGTGAGVYGQADGVSGVGVLGGSTSGQAVRGTSNSGFGVYGLSGSGQGVYGTSTSKEGVAGQSGSNTGVYGRSTSYYGVAGRGDNNHGSVGVTAAGSFAGVYGLSEHGSSTGVRGQAAGGIGVDGITATGRAIQAKATGTGTGIVATSVGGPAAVLGSDRAHLVLTPNTANRPAPTADSTVHGRGEILVDGNGDLWMCVTAGTPGTWRKLSGPSTAGAFHVLPAPARVYDSRTGTPQGPKSPLAGGSARQLDLKVASSGVPAGATAALVTLLLVNAATGDGNFTIWAAGAARPTANSMVWGGTAKRFSSLAVTALDAQARCQVASSVKTDFVLDVVGYYR